MHKKVLLQIAVIIILSVLLGILYNNLSMNPLPLVSEKSEDFSQSDSLMNVMMRQDSILKAADSLKLLSQKRQDSIKLIGDQKMKDSLDRAATLDSLKHVADSLKAAKKHIEDSLKSVANQTKDTTTASFVKPVEIKLDFAKLLFDKKYRFVDARDESDYNAGHIQGAVNIPYHKYDESKSKLGQFTKSQVIVVYCGEGCDVSIDLAYAMAKEGFTKLYIFRGGWDEWKAAGYPTQ